MSPIDQNDFRPFESDLTLSVRPLTTDRWPSFERLFDTKGSCSRCWCMYWRLGYSYRRHLPEENKASFHKIVQSGPAPGLLAFAGPLAVGWCHLTPRRALPAIDSMWRFRSVDDIPVWSLSCFYTRKSYRRRGVTSVLIAEALATAKRAGAPALEAYPVDADLTRSTSSTGYVSTFIRAGFKTVARRVPTRPIMRHDLRRVTESPFDLGP
jgi:GNAT superfamily N-acetyltransferase